MPFTSLNGFVEIASHKGKKRLVIAVAHDTDVLLAAKSAFQAGITVPVLVGDKEKIVTAAKQAGLNLSDVEIIHEPDSQLACTQAVKMVRNGKADILMKGLVSTGILVREILNKDYGLLTGSILSHLAFFETAFYHKILCVTDAALNISPDINDKIAIVRNAESVYQKLTTELPLIAILAPVETVNPKMEATVHAAMLTLMQKRNQIKGCVIDGPLALDNAVSANAARHKGLNSDVAGNADILIAPDLNSGNLLYKSLNFLGGAVAAAIVAGASVPVVLTSRADNEKSKFLSIALAASMDY
jgi:phosphate butyryltransferase